MPCNQSLDSRSETGSAVTEFVLVLIILLPLVLGLIQLGLIIQVRNVLAAAASEGAREAARLDATPVAGIARTRELVTAATNPDFAKQISVHPTNYGGVSVMTVSITARVPMLGLAGPGVVMQVRGHAIKEVLP